MKRLFLLVVVAAVLLAGVLGVVAQDEEVDYLAAIPPCTSDDFDIIMEALTLFSYDHDEFIATLNDGDVNQALRAAELMTSTWPIYRDGLPTCSIAMHMDSVITNMISSAHLSVAYLKMGDADAEQYIDAYVRYSEMMTEMGLSIAASVEE